MRNEKSPRFSKTPLISLLLVLGIFYYLFGFSKKILNPMVGKELPYFEINRFDSNAIMTNKFLSKKPFLLNFFASW